MAPDPLPDVEIPAPASGPQYGSLRRIVSTLAVAAVGFIFLSGVGFGAKTSCTNTAAVSGLDEAPCDTIDAWTWGGLLLALVIPVVGYAVAVPKLIRELHLLAGIALVLIAAAIGMASVQPT